MHWAPCSHPPLSPYSCLMHLSPLLPTIVTQLGYPIVAPSSLPISHHLTHVNVFKGILSTLLSPPCVFPLNQTWSGLTHNVGFSPVCPAHLGMSPAPHILITSLGPGQSCCAHTSCPVHMPLTCPILPHLLCLLPQCILLTLLGPWFDLSPCICLSPVHLAHLIRTQSCLIPQVGLLPGMLLTSLHLSWASPLCLSGMVCG